MRRGDAGTGGEATKGADRVTELGQSEQGRELGDAGVTTARSCERGKGQQRQIPSKTSWGEGWTLSVCCGKAPLVSLEIRFCCGT